MTSTAVHRWNTEIQEGINNMLQLLMDLVAARLKHQPVPQCLMDMLTMVSIKHQLVPPKPHRYPHCGQNKTSACSPQCLIDIHTMVSIKYQHLPPMPQISTLWSVKNISMFPQCLIDIHTMVSIKHQHLPPMPHRYPHYGQYKTSASSPNAS